MNTEKYVKTIRQAGLLKFTGSVSQIVGLTVESNGPTTNIGDICRMYTNDSSSYVQAEVVGFRDSKVLLMPMGDLSGVGQNSRVVSSGHSLRIPASMGFRGRILDGMGNPIDEYGPIVPEEFTRIDNPPPNPLTRRRIKEILPVGVKAIDALLTIGRGQRVGIFAGSGVGKSTLMGMIARNCKADINVIALVGERGREVRDFIEKDLQEEGLKRSVLVVATSDQPALCRLKCPMVATSIAEYYRDKGMDVMLLMDSLTRFAMAQREIGMAIGEPPVSRGYTPSVYAIMPKLLERSGTSDKGSITGFYSVLVEGDDMNEPIADTVRGILDGHIVLSRALANNNHYPAIDVLASISRLMPDISTPEHFQAANLAKNLISTHREAQDLINIGAYKTGSNPKIDQAIKMIDPINNLLKQRMNDKFSFEETLSELLNLTSGSNDR